MILVSFLGQILTEPFIHINCLIALHIIYVYAVCVAASARRCHSFYVRDTRRAAVVMRCTMIINNLYQTLGEATRKGPPTRQTHQAIMCLVKIVYSMQSQARAQTLNECEFMRINRIARARMRI